MWSSTSPITVLPLLLSSALAAPPKSLQSRDTPGYTVTGYSDSMCGGTASVDHPGYSWSWPVPADAQGMQCFAYKAKDDFSPDHPIITKSLGSVQISGLPADKCLLIQFSHEVVCPINDDQKFAGDGIRGNGCYNPSYFDSDKSAPDRIFFNVGLSPATCPTEPQGPAPAAPAPATSPPVAAEPPVPSPV
ncbi:hypothetical protein BGZ63DRAFT_436773 [Mariannaea sp. PMI_226]|nr:hypothetical protein BGZ63DRAFT_436773 [Mariannaea sp. PMI_226]